MLTRNDQVAAQLCQARDEPASELLAPHHPRTRRGGQESCEFEKKEIQKGIMSRTIALTSPKVDGKNKIYQLSTVARDLRFSNNVWWRFLDDYDHRPTPSRCQKIMSTTQQFANEVERNRHNCNALVNAISKGKELVECSLEWDEPTIGKRGNDTDIARGQQWRLAMAWAGFEMVSKAVVGKRRLGTSGFRRIESVCACLPSYIPTEAPKSTAKLERWLNEDWCKDNVAAMDYLGLSGPDIYRTMRSWLVEKQNITSWTECLNLCRGFRHTTAHGALSATKVKQWRLAQSMAVLTSELAIVTAAILIQLVLNGTQDIRTSGEKVKTKRATRKNAV